MVSNFTADNTYTDEDDNISRNHSQRMNEELDINTPTKYYIRKHNDVETVIKILTAFSFDTWQIFNLPPFSRIPLGLSLFLCISLHFQQFTRFNLYWDGLNVTVSNTLLVSKWLLRLSRFSFYFSFLTSCGVCCNHSSDIYRFSLEFRVCTS